jgi:DNA helicase-2/ATP-dependent DNA helicase PcrA
MIADPSRFLNEVPLELLENLTRGPSWLGFASSPDTAHNREAVAALKGESSPAIKRTSNYSGKTYNSAQSVRDFFKSRERKDGSGQSEDGKGSARGVLSEPAPGAPSTADAASMRVGSRVKHARYGRGVVLQIEGHGGDAKLTVSFPGFGQKKFVAKYAVLENAQ